MKNFCCVILLKNIICYKKLINFIKIINLSNNIEIYPDHTPILFFVHHTFLYLYSHHRILRFFLSKGLLEFSNNVLTIVGDELLQYIDMQNMNNVLLFDNNKIINNFNLFTNICIEYHIQWKFISFMKEKNYLFFIKFLDLYK